MIPLMFLLQLQTQAQTPSVTEQVTEQAAEPEDRPLVMPTLGGPAGDFRVVSTDVGAPWTFRIALHGEFFQSSSFIVDGDENARMLGTVAIALTPSKYLELYTAFRGSSNRNTRNDPARTDPEVVTALGDPSFGVKGRYPINPVLDVGADFGLKFLNSVSGLSFDGDATNLWITGIASADLRNTTSHAPVRFHANFGYLMDKSSKLIDFGMPPRDAQTRMAATFGYGMGRSRVRMAAAVDAPIHTPQFDILPFAEYHAEIVTGEADTFWAMPGLVPADKLSGTSMQYMTVGVRAVPMRGLTLDLGTDIGLSSVGFEYGAPTPPWNLIFGASYTYDPLSSKKIVRTVTRTANAEPRDGRIRGTVRSSTGARAIPNAVVALNNVKEGRLATSEDGSFTSFPVAPGTVDLTVSADGYEPTVAHAIVSAGHDAIVDINLAPKPPAGHLHGKVVDEAGKPVEGAIVKLSGPTTDQIPTQQGNFEKGLPVGTYVARAEAPNYLTKERTVELKQGSDEGIEFLLRPRPADARVEIKGDHIVVKSSVHFEVGKAELAIDSRGLLDEVADVMVQHPELKKVRVEGHTDNSGRKDKNEVLSRDRAAAVVAYLTSQGIAASRLESEGYGQSKPLVPNLSKANKEKNRRVEFRIIDGPGAAPEIKP
jgi:outer membrane protein OmpA-like peptidoglycan-associated protein